jgi:hypothetical protein
VNELHKIGNMDTNKNETAIQKYIKQQSEAFSIFYHQTATCQQRL